MSRRIQCALPGYESAWVDLPDEWLGAHLARRDEAVRAASKYRDGKITIAAISLCIVDDWGGIPGLEGRDPAQWDFLKLPIVLIVWLESVVFEDFAKAFTVPKASSALSPRGLRGLLTTIQKRITAGNSAMNR